MAVTGEPGEATPPETWNQPAQPPRASHQVDMMRAVGRGGEQVEVVGVAGDRRHRRVGPGR